MEKARLLQETRAPPRPAPRAQRVRPHRHRRSEDAARPRARRRRSARAGERAHHGRERHGQGAHRRGDPRGVARAPKRRSCASTARRSPSRSSRASSSATRRARSPAPSRGARGASSRPTAARSSSTRSARSRTGTQVKLLRFLQEKTLRARRRQRDAQGRRAHHRRDEPRSQGGDREGRVPRGSLLPPQRRRRRAPAAARARARHRRRSRASSSARYATENGKQHRGLRATTRSRRSPSYDWPGNVRELENVDRARGRPLRRRRRSSVRHLPADARARRASATAPPPIPGSTIAGSRALRDPEDARGVRRLDVEGGDDPRHLDRARSSTSCTSTGEPAARAARPTSPRRRA